MRTAHTPTDTPIAMAFVLFFEGAGVGVGVVLGVEEELVLTLVVDDDGVAVAVPGIEIPVCPKLLITTQGSIENTPVEFVQHVPPPPVAVQQ
jgi:hypothetical protein